MPQLKLINTNWYGAALRRLRISIVLLVGVVLVPMSSGHVAHAETRNAVIIDTQSPLTSAERDRLAEAGLAVGNLVDDNQYFGSVSVGDTAETANAVSAVVPGIEVDDVPREVKLRPVVAFVNASGDAAPGDTIDVLVRPSVGSDEADALTVLQQIDPDARVSSRRQAIAVTVPVEQLNDLADLSFVEQIEPNAGFPFLQ